MSSLEGFLHTFEILQLPLSLKQTLVVFQAALGTF